MSEMIERVGRAICQRLHGDTCRMVVRPDYPNCTRKTCDQMRFAVAAIEAMGEPSEAMVAEVINPGEDGDGAVNASEALYIWHAMIDVALNRGRLSLDP